MKMKKLIALAIATSMCVMMIGCSGKEEAAATDTSSEAEVSEEGTDLFEYLLCPVDDLGALIPELEQDGEQYSAKEEKAFDGLSLAGPFVDVNADNLITGITYSGTKYCLSRVWVGDSMDYAGRFLKENGFTFKSVDFAHGTAQYVVTYAADGIEIILVSDESGDFDKSEESDVTGCVAIISCYYN